MTEQEERSQIKQKEEVTTILKETWTSEFMKRKVVADILKVDGRIFEYIDSIVNHPNDHCLREQYRNGFLPISSPQERWKGKSLKRRLS